MGKLIRLAIIERAISERPRDRLQRGLVRSEKARCRGKLAILPDLRRLHGFRRAKTLARIESDDDQPIVAAGA